MSKSELLDKAADYLGELQKASNFEEVLQLWRRTSLPYRLDRADPYSDEYRAEVLEVYAALAESSYDVANEWTSNKQSGGEFEIGYPWISGNLGIISDEMAKPMQILRALHDAGKSGCSIIEFGSGWGNLALPLARARQNVSIVDIDQGFIDRTLRKAQAEGLEIGHYCGDFLEVAQKIPEKFDVAVFQSSFHHCMDFAALIRALKSNVLNDAGLIIFASEPINRELGFPWGLRYDGESLWAIMCNKWLELGFDLDFFTEMVLRAGFFLRRIEGIPGWIGEGWLASRVENGLNFGEWQLPLEYDRTFYPADVGFPGRHCSKHSMLPGLAQADLGHYELTFGNFSTASLSVTVTGSQVVKTLVQPGEDAVLQVAAGCDQVQIHSECFVPDQQRGNGDLRTLGVYLKSVRLY